MDPIIILLLELGGFSINGKHRNIGRVGQHMRMSKGLSRMKSINSTGCAVKTYDLHDPENPDGEPHLLPLFVPTKSKNVPVWKGAAVK